MIRKFILLIILLFTLSGIIYSDCTCFYFPGIDLTKNICDDFNHLIKCKSEVLDNISFFKSKSDIIILAGFGSYKGMFLTNNFYNPDKNLLLWSEIAKKKAKLIIIDSCFSGYVFDYKPVSDIVTSTGKEQSWNIIDEYNRNTSSFTATLRCFYDSNYKCPVPKNYCKTLNGCQFNIIFSQIDKFYSRDIANDMYDWEFPSIGTMLFNGKIIK